MLRIVHFIFCLAVASSSWSQVSPEIWEVESFKNLRTNEERTYSCAFKVYPGDRIDWIQGNHIQSFPVTSNEGALPRKGNGSITYHIEKEGKYGRVVIERVESSLFMTIDLTGSSVDIDHFISLAVDH